MRKAVVVLLVLGLAGSMGMTAVPTTSAVNASVITELALAVGDPLCEHNCTSCASGRHFDETEDPEVWDALDEFHTSEECGALFSCDDAHPESCVAPGGGGGNFASTRDAVEAVRVLIAEHDADGLGRVMDGVTVAYVAARQAVQVRNCSGEIVANFPVSDVAVKSLATP